MRNVTRRVSSPDLVGRREEFSALVDALEQAKSGHPQCVLVGGEAGVGKTRILSAFMEHGGESDVRFLFGNCVELTDGHLPFAPVVQALRGFVHDADPQTVTQMIGPAGEDLARLVPELGTYGEGAGLGILAFDSARGRLFEAVLGLLERLGEPGGVALVFEDLHWADDSTRDLIAFLIRNMRSERLLLIGSYRSDELHRQHPLRPFLASLDTDKVERIQLERLGRDEVRVQLAGILGAEPEEMLVDRVFERSEGNPFYVEELLATSSGDLEIGLPNTLRDALMVRVEVLSPAAQQVLRVASVAGRQVDHGLLQGVMELDEDELIAALREAVSRYLLEPGRGNDAYAFRHALVREAVYDDLLPGERTRLHSAFARVLSQRRELDGEGGATASAELAYHYFAAHDLEAALVASVQAGRTAYEALAFSESCRHYERALELWEQVPDAAAKAGMEQLDILRDTGESSFLLGDAERAAALFRAALDLVDTADDPVTAALLHERVSKSLWVGGHGQAALTECARAVELLAGEPPSAERARVLAADGQMLMVSSKFEDSKKRCEEAIEIAKRVGDRAVEGHALNTLGSAIAMLGEPDRGIECLRRARAIAYEVGNVDDIARSYTNLETMLSLVAGRFEEAAQECREGIEVTKKLGLEKNFGFWLMADLGRILWEIGEWDEAEAVSRGIGATGVAPTQGFVQMWLAEIATGRGHFDEASAGLDGMAEVASRIVDPQFLAPYYSARAELALWKRRPDDAATSVRDGFHRVDDTDDINESARLCWLGMRAEADRVQAGAMTAKERKSGEVGERASELHERARQLSERLYIDGKVFAPVALAYTESAEAEYSRSLGKSDPDLWASAALQWEEIQHRFEFAYARWREAEAALSAGDKSRAERVAREGYQIATKLGAGPLSTEIEALARRGRLKLVSSDGAKEEEATIASPIDTFGLTPREVEVLRLVVEGKTNPEIAEELFISEKTASVHVSHILAKLGVSGRVEAAGVAHRLGL
jgi:DNA-binding CsgD family transcriptional regulator/tetratricopeptide (TPR) repeat protein